MWITFLVHLHRRIDEVDDMKSLCDNFHKLNIEFIMNSMIAQQQEWKCAETFIEEEWLKALDT